MLGIGIGWILGVCAMYFVTVSGPKDLMSSQSNKIDIYIDSIEGLADVLYQYGVVQDKESFEKFLKNKNLPSSSWRGRKITFSKAMSYEEIFEAVYKSYK